MAKKFKSKVILTLSLLGACIGLALIFNGQIKNALVHQNQVAGINKITKKTVEKNKNKKASYDFSKVHSLGWKEVTDSRISKNTYDYGIGTIAIPDVGMYSPIEKGLSNTNMAIGACTMRSDQVMGGGQKRWALRGNFIG